MDNVRICWLVSNVCVIVDTQGTYVTVVCIIYDVFIESYIQNLVELCYIEVEGLCIKSVITQCVPVMRCTWRLLLLQEDHFFSLWVIF